MDEKIPKNQSYIVNLALENELEEKNYEIKLDWYNFWLTKTLVSLSRYTSFFDKSYDEKSLTTTVNSSSNKLRGSNVIPEREIRKNDSKLGQIGPILRLHDGLISLNFLLAEEALSQNYNQVNAHFP